MKIVIEKEALFEGLQRVFSVVPQKPTLPVLTNYLFRASNGLLSISGTDMDMSITTVLDCVAEGEGAVTVNAKRFLSIIRELPAGNVTIEVDGDRITVEFAQGRSSMMGMSAADFPTIKDDVEGASVTISGDELFEMIDKTSFAVATERTRVALTGVYWRVESGAVTMVATDGHRLSLMGRNIDVSNNLESSLLEAIVPPKALAHAARVFSSGDILRRVVFGKGVILFDFGSTTIFSKLIEGPYPDFRQVIPTANSKKVTVSTADLEAAVRRVSVMSSSITHQIRLYLSRGSMEISTTNVDIGGEASETLDVKYDGDSMKSGFNAMFLQEILKKLETDEVLIELETPTSACILKPAGSEDKGEHLYLIMPLRLND